MKNTTEEEKDKKEELLEPLNMAMQLVFDRLATSCVGAYCDKPYYILDAINILISDLKELEPEPSIFKKVRIYKFICGTVKSYYDTTHDNKIAKEDVTSQKFIEFRKAMQDITLIDTDIYKIFFDIIKKTKLQYRSIPNEYFARAERKYKSFEPKEEQEFRLTKSKKEEEGDFDI